MRSPGVVHTGTKTFLRKNLQSGPAQSVMLSEKQGKVGNLDGKSSAELKDLLIRQEKLLANRAFLKKLPDGGAKVQAFADKLKSILEERGDVDGAARFLDKLKLTDVNTTEDEKDSPGTITSTQDKQSEKESSFAISDDTRFQNLHSNVFSKTLQNDSAKFMPNRALRSKCIPSDIPRPDKPAVKEKSAKEKDITSAYSLPLKKESVKSVNLSESIRLQLDQQKKLEVLRAEQASERLAERLGIQIGEFTLEVEEVGSYRELVQPDSDDESEGGSDQPEADGKDEETAE